MQHGVLPCRSNGLSQRFRLGLNGLEVVPEMLSDVIEHGFNVRPDLVAIDNPINPRDYIGKFWIDSLVHDEAAMKYIVNVIGEDSICLGSDYPFPLGEHHPGSLIESMQFNLSAKEKFLYKNGMDWLGL